jgi:hypothetical protein
MPQRLDQCEPTLPKSGPVGGACRVPGFAAGTRRGSKVEIQLHVHAGREQTRVVVVSLGQTNRAEPGRLSGPTSSELRLDDRAAPMSWLNQAPTPNRRPRFPLGALCEFVYLSSAPPTVPAAVGEAQR